MRRHLVAGIPLSASRNRSAGRLRSSAQPVEPMAEGKVAAHGNVEIARLTIDWPFPRVEPCLLFLKIDSTMGKRRREITYDCVRHVRCNDSGGILVVMRLVNTLDQRPDIGFIFRTLRFQCYG